MKKYSNDGIQSVIDRDWKTLNFAEVKLENECEERVCSDLNLWDGRNTKFGYADVSWSSSDPDSVSTSGEVICLPEEKKVTITAHFSYQDYPEINIDKSFVLNVLKGSGKGRRKLKYNRQKGKTGHFCYWRLHCKHISTQRRKQQVSPNRLGSVF